MTLLCGTGVGVDALLEMFKARAPTLVRSDRATFNFRYLTALCGAGVRVGDRGLRGTAC